MPQYECKFNDKEKWVDISEKDQALVIRIRDNGIGLEKGIWEI